MNKAFYSYQPIDIEDELFLSDIPLDVLESSIRSQFDCPLEYRKKDYIQSFITKYEFTLENLDDEEQFDLEAYHDKFIGFLQNIFEEYLGIGFVDLGNMSEDDQHDILQFTYRFFIKNIKKNFVNIVINYINNSRDEIINSNMKKKDVTSINFKSEIDDEYDILVLSNLSDIINMALDELKESYDIDQFFNLCEIDEPILELDYIRSKFDSMDITGNFIEKYIDMIDAEFRVEIQSKVRNKILKKYPKRILKTEIKEKKEDNEELEDTSNETEK